MMIMSALLTVAIVRVSADACPIAMKPAAQVTANKYALPILFPPSLALEQHRQALCLIGIAINSVGIYKAALRPVVVFRGAGAVRSVVGLVERRSFACFPSVEQGGPKTSGAGASASSLKGIETAHSASDCFLIFAPVGTAKSGMIASMVAVQGCSRAPNTISVPKKAFRHTFAVLNISRAAAFASPAPLGNSRSKAPTTALPVLRTSRREIPTPDAVSLAIVLLPKVL